MAPGRGADGGPLLKDGALERQQLRQVVYKASSIEVAAHPQSPGFEEGG